MELKKFWKTFLISLGCVLLIAGGVYIYFKDPFGFRKIKVDKYSEILDWCDVSNSKDELDVDCKALLLNIRNKENGDGCFDVEVISNEENLENINICEQNEAFSYSNEVLQYKKLMPIDATFVFQREQFLGKYIFKSVTFSPVDTSYIQEMINKDVKYLSGVKSSNVTTIKNSVNFCPIPNSLPEYITDENKNLYSIFYDSEKLDNSFFSDGTFYNFSNNNLQIIFACESQIESGYVGNCLPTTINITDDLSKAFLLKPKGINFEQTLTQINIDTLKYISIMHDGEEFMRYTNEEKLIETFISSLYFDQNINENLYCGMYKFLKNVTNKSPEMEEYVSYMESYINENITEIKSGLCRDAIDKTKLDYTGLYLKNYISNTHNISIFSVLNECINLNMYLN